jgi:radical SAM protein with 4Fe4S-binding SPASM domain
MEHYLFPKRVEIELSSKCNLSCSYCPRRFIDNLDGFMEYSLFKRIIDEISEYPETILVLHRRGESLLHPQFVSFLNLIKDNFNNVQLATNGTLLDREKAEAIIQTISFLSFSIDTPSLFNQTRINAKYDMVEKNILDFIALNRAYGSPVKTQVSKVMTKRSNESDNALFNEIWSEKVDRVRIYEQHSEEGKFGSLKNKRSDRKTCTMPFYELVVCYDGKIARCNHDWDGDAMGNINNTTIYDVWHSEKFEMLRSQQTSLQISDSVCLSCDSWYPKEGKQETGLAFESKKQNDNYLKNVSKTFIPLARPHITTEVDEVSKVINSGMWTTGPKVFEFENKLADYLTEDQPLYVSGINSCTSALFLALFSLGVKRGDEVILPTWTFAATAQVVEWLQAVPVLCDIDKSTLCIDVDEIESLISHKTKAIIPVHIGGYSCNLNMIKQIADKYDLFVIEDAAHAIGTKYFGKKIGNFSHATCFSFYATKNLAMGEGGACVSNNYELIESIKKLSYFGINKEAYKRYEKFGTWFYNIEKMGFKFNLDSIHAAMGLVQLEKLDQMNTRRRKIAKTYRKGLDDSII